MTLVSTSIIKFMENFLTEAEINLIISDINNLEIYFPLGKSKSKNYLNILVNVFMKYRVECLDISALSGYSLLNYGSDFNSNIVGDKSSSYEILEFKNKIDSDLTYISESSFKQFYQSIASSVPELDKVDIISTDSPDYILNTTLSSASKSHDFGFASYFQINLKEKSKKNILPDKIPTKSLLDGIERCLRYYTYNLIFKSWNYTYLSVYNKNFDLSKLSELKRAYFILEWFFTNYNGKINFFHIQTSNNFREWVEYCSTGVFNTFEQPIASKIEFNTILVEKSKIILSLLSSEPFCASEACIDSILYDVLNYFIQKSPLNELSNVASFEIIISYYEHLELLFKQLDINFESEKSRLQANQILDLLINKLVLNAKKNKSGLKFPFKLLWLLSNDSKSPFLYKDAESDTDKKFLDFIHQYSSSKVQKTNFADLSQKIDKLLIIQDKLVIIGDLPSNLKVDLPTTEDLAKINKKLSNDDLKVYARLDLGTRKILSHLKKFWYTIIGTNDLYVNDPIFKDFFDISEKKETFGIVDQLEDYLKNWNEYKLKSTVIKKLEEEIEIVSKLKYNVEGLRLLTRKFSGAMSFVQGKALMEKEKTRLIDAILKDLIGTQLSFHFNEGIKSKLDLVDLSTSGNEKIISSAIDIVEQTQQFKKQILAILEPQPVIPTIEAFIGLAKTLLGNTFKTIQITRFLENYNNWLTRLHEESQLLVIGLHIKNFNEFLVSLFGTINNTISQISRFYKSSLPSKLQKAIVFIQSTKNMGVFVTTLKEINPLLQALINDLNTKLVNLHLYSEKLAEITEELFTSYSQLLDTNQILEALNNIKIKYKYEKTILTIEERITDKESLLRKQLFIEKAFRLSLLVNSAFVLIEKQINDEFKPLIISSSYNSLEEVGDNVSLEDRIEIIKTILENIVEFLKSIKILSRRHTQVLKIITYYAPILIDQLGVKEALKPKVFSILQLINNYNRHIKDFSVLKDLNKELLEFNEQIFESFSTFLPVYIANQTIQNDIKNLIVFQSNEPIYSRNFLFWAKKIQIAVELIASDMNINTIVSDLSNKFQLINLDKVQEEILSIFIARREEEKLVFKKKQVFKKTALDKEQSYQEEIASLKERIALLEDQLKALQEENLKLKELTQLEKPLVFESPHRTDEIEAENYAGSEAEVKPIHLSDLRQEKLPTEEVRVKPNIDPLSVHSTKIESDALKPAKSAEEVNVDIIEKIDPKPIVEEDELASLPEYDLIKELRKVSQLEFVPRYNGNENDLISEIESIIETQKILGGETSRQIITPERNENDELVEEVTRKRTTEPESIFSFNLEEKVVPETTFRFKSPSEMVKFSDSKDKKPQEKSLDTMKSLKEEIAEYDEKPTPLELKINTYARELFGDEEEEETTKGKNNDPSYDLVNEMEKLVGSDKKNKPSAKN